jgi:hypothetical protein
MQPLSSDNRTFQLAWELVEYTNRHVFLTGKAGTGKTTFLRHLKQHTHKNIAIAAPTGVAAINAGGTTLHSLLQLPFGPFVPASITHSSAGALDRHTLLTKIKMSSRRRKVIQELDLLVIDEISMVRADLLDMIDLVLRHFRKAYHEPFGGVQMLYIGDMFQLPPVASQADWDILQSHYRSVYFFDSKVVAQKPPLYIELTKVYRQSDQQFIDVLNEVRNNQLSDAGLALLQSRYKPGFVPRREDNYITLTTHNYKADRINAEELESIRNPVHLFEATVNNDFPETAYPAERELKLKVGAQVMFLKNDLETPRRYFNGKIGTVKHISEEGILVHCPGDEHSIKVPRETWRNLRYRYDEQAKSVEEEELGTFSQFPLRLAWAITIHKSQGLTFEKAIIDAGGAFAPGQVYVALSRCTTLQGMVLLSLIHPGLTFADERIAGFGRKKRDPLLLEDELKKGKQEFTEVLLPGLFNLANLISLCSGLHKAMLESRPMFEEKAFDWATEFGLVMDAAQQQATPFWQSIQAFVSVPVPVAQNTPLQKALKEGSEAVCSFYNGKIWPHWKNLPRHRPGANRTVAEHWHDACAEVQKQLEKHYEKLLKLKEGFAFETFFTRMAFHAPQKEVVKQYVPPVRETSSNENPHPELYARLRVLTEAIMLREDLPVYRVASKHTLQLICQVLPQTPERLSAVSGFKKWKTDMFGDEFLDEIKTYCQEKGIVPDETDMPPLNTQQKTKEKRPACKGATQQATYDLYKQGKTIGEIAKERNLATSTIESHLASFVKAGVLKVEDFVSPEKIAVIERELPDELEGFAMTLVKEKLGNDFSYGEIKMVLARKQAQLAKAAATQKQETTDVV